MRGHWFNRTLLWAVLAVALWAPAAPAQEEPIRIGALFSVTGPASFLGAPEANTALMLIEQVNAQGGINGRKVEILIEDTQGAEEKAVEGVKNLIAQNVVAIVGPSRSGTTMAVIPHVEQNEVPLISCAAAEEIVVPVKKWVFKTPQKDSDAVHSIYILLQRAGIKRVAILTGTTGFGIAGREQLRKFAPDYGIEIVVDETYKGTDTDMKPQLMKVKASNAQAIVNWSIVAAQTIVMKNAKELKIDLPILQSHGFGNIKFARAAGEAAEGVIFPCGRLLVAETMRDVNCQKAPLLEYKKAYEERFKDDVSTFGGHAYDAMMLVLCALRDVGPDRAKIRDYIETTKGFIGTGGVFYFSPEDHNGLGLNAFEMITIKDGQFQPYGQ